jgi:hypothetical protein
MIMRCPNLSQLSTWLTKAFSRQFLAVWTILLVSMMVSLCSAAKLPVPPPQPAPSHQVLNIAYFSQSGGLQATLGVQNNTLASKDVTFTIFNRNGEALHLGVIPIEPGVRAFNLVDLTKGAKRFESGNIELEFEGQPGEVRCQAGVLWPEKRISFESRASTPNDFRSAELNGIAWLPDRGSEATVAVTNASDHRVIVSFSTGEQSRQIILTPRATHVVRLREGLSYERESGAVLVRLQHDGEPGAVIATGFVVNPEKGYSTTFGFVDPKSIMTNRLAGAHVWFGYPDSKEGFPQDTKFRAPLILANVGDKPVKARVSVDYTLSATAASLGVAEERIRPAETKVIELTDEMAKLGIAGPVEDAGVDITYDGAPGSLIAHLTSVDQTGDFSLETPIKDPGEVMHRSGNAHPWSLENGTRTVLHLKNTTDKKVAVLVQIRFLGGSYNPDRIILQPFQTIAIDMQELKDSKKKDIRGNIFPETAMGGLVEWIEQTSKAVIGRAEHVNVAEGISRSFSCPSCPCQNSFVSDQMSPPAVSANVGAAGSFFTPEENMQDCNGVAFGPYPVRETITWSASGSAAAVDGTGFVNCLAPGLSTITATFDEATYWYWTGPYENTCENNGVSSQAASGTVTVKPTANIQGSLGYVYIGHDPQVVLFNFFFGVGNPSGGTYSWSSPSSGISFDNSTASQVHVTSTTYSGVTNDTKIALDYAKNGQSATQAFVNVTKRIFKYLSGPSLIQRSALPGDCGSSPCYGYMYDAKYNVYAQPGSALVQAGGLNGTLVIENVSIGYFKINGVPSSPVGNLHTGAGSLDSNSEVHDALGITNGSPLPSGLDEQLSQDLSVGGIFVRNNTNHLFTSNATVTSNGPSN